jgi:hypothetical protein
VVDPGQPASLKFSVKAMRSIAGKVMVYDNQALKTVPFAGATVHLKELSLETKTGENGAFIFRSLPAGTYTIMLEHQGKEITRQVVLPTGPANIRDIELNAGTK